MMRQLQMERVGVVLVPVGSGTVPELKVELVLGFVLDVHQGR